MLRWNMWISNQCPSCRLEIEDTNHIVSCPAPNQIEHLTTQLTKLEGTLISKHIPPLAAAMMLQVLFPQWYPQQAGIQPPDPLLRSQLAIAELKWGLPSIYWRQHLEIFNPDPMQWNRTLRWISTFLQQLWNTGCLGYMEVSKWSHPQSTG